MSIYGAFSYATLGMMAQSDTMRVIGGNIANINTGGYKETENRFKTVLGETITGQSDIGGVRTVGVQHIAQQGNVTASARELDVAITGAGFFVLNTEIDGSGDTYYTRDGALYQKMVDTDTKESYLVDKNGYYVMGWQGNSDGTIDTSGQLSGMRIDPGSFTASGEATSTVDMDVNVPSNASTGDVENYRLEVHDGDFSRQSIDVNFTKNAAVNTWDISITYPGTPASVTTPTQTLSFDNKGRATSTTPLTFTLDWNGGTSTDIAFDFSKSTQFSGAFSTYNIIKDGLGSSSMRSISFDELGHVVGSFEDGTLRNVFKLGLGTFSNPDALKKHNGNVFSETPESGSVTTTEAQDNGFAYFSPNALEGSNVDLADQFSKMIMTQNAYNSSATVFRTVDEMVTTARDLKK